MNERNDGIAIVGMGCWYPGARDIRQLWENVVARRREFRRVPSERLNMDDYFDPDPRAPDKTYAQRAAVIDGFVFDWARYLIPQDTYFATDIAQWLSLEVAGRALADAGYTRESVPKERTGVLLGNSLTGEQMRSNYLRARWPFVRRALESATQAAGLSASMRGEISERMEHRYKSVFPKVTEDALAGSLSNTIAGRICNYFDLHGGGYVVDAACASSLVAVCQAADQLAQGEMDLVLAGGVDISLDTLEFVGFAKATALTSDEMHVYDRRGAGFIPAEGCGFVVLKREADARAAKDPIYAVIRGWGVSSDGKGGIMQPTRGGQARALRRAYARAGYPASSLDFIEGHGTGTRVGDKVEVQAIADVIADEGGVSARKIGLSSLKSVVGHAKAAAGVGALIKAALSANRRVMPPVANCTQWNSVFDDTARALYPITQGEVKDAAATLRIGVSAMGFGGINSHVTLESGDAPFVRLAPQVSERALLVSAQSTELFVFGASSVPELLQTLPTLAAEAERMSLGDLTDFAAHLASRISGSPAVRAAVIASKPVELAERLRTLQNTLRTDALDATPVWTNAERTVWVGRAEKSPRVGFLFPGQGSQQLGMARVLVERFEWARELVEELDERRVAAGQQPLSPIIFRPLDRAADAAAVKEWEKALASTDVAQPAICLASVLYAQWLKRLGIEPEVVAGHSLGELTAFHWAGAFDRWTLFAFASLRGQRMSAPSDEAGTMLSLSCDAATARSLLEGLQDSVTLANLNAPTQTVVSGTQAGISEVAQRAAQRGVDTRRLNVSNAFHSALMAPAAKALRESTLLPEQLGALGTRLVSSVDGQGVQAGRALRAHFADQVMQPVDFVATARAMQAQCDCLVEVGPGRVLSGLVKESGGACLPVASKPDADADLNSVVGFCFVAGVPVQLRALHAERLVRPYVQPSERVFIENACEKPFAADEAPVRPAQGDDWRTEITRALELSPEVASGYLSARGEFLREALLALARADLAAFRPELAPKRTPTRSAPSFVMPAAREVEPPRQPALAAAAPSFEKMITALVAQRTGFPEANIASQARLLDDLNIDSIKAGELIAAAARQAGVAGKIDPGSLANQSVAQIAEAFRSAGGSEPQQSAPPSAPTRARVATLEETLLDMVAERTGYPRAQLSAQARLLDDLNLDSIKAGELIARAARLAGVAGKVDPGGLAQGSVQDIAAALRQAGGQLEVTAAPAEVELVPAKAPEPERRDTQGRLIQLVVDRTGFPARSIDVRVKLLDDLNIDSIKAGEIIATAAREAGVGGKVDPGSLSNASLLDIARAIDAAAGVSHPPSAAPAAAPPSNEVEVAVVEAVQAITGYSARAVRLSLSLAELGIKGERLAEMLRQLCARVGISNRLDSTRLENNTLAQLVDILTARLVSEALPVLADASLEDSPSWVRNYIVRTEPSPRRGRGEGQMRRAEDDWREATVLLLAEQADAPIVEALNTLLLQSGARVELASFAANAQSRASESSRFSHVLAVLPSSSSQAHASDSVRAQLARLLSVAKIARAESAPRRRTTLAFVQYGHGQFGLGKPLARPEVCGATSFARSLHLERSDLRVRVVDLSPVLAQSVAAERVLEECATSDAFLAVGYAESGTRYEQRAVLAPPSEYLPRAKPLGRGDVVLVTGGAKGITAECALALAQNRGVTLALVGRQRHQPSEANAGDELSANLARFQEAGVSFRYYSCDMAARDEVVNLIERVSSELGPIAGVIHGAGVMKPRRAEQLSVQGALEEISPKLVGALNLAEALSAAPPRLLMGFSSLSGVIGVPGTTVYAFSNEAMDLVFRRFAEAHPQTDVVCAAWGPWGDVGRAVKFGTSDNLHKLGFHLGTLPAQRAVERFLQLVEGRPPDSQVTVVGRVVGFDTWAQLMPRPSAPSGLRFLESVVRWEPGVELVARAQLNLEKDRYLHDHIFHGMYVVPSVFSLEAAAQAAVALAGGEWTAVRRFEHVDLPRPIVVDADRGLEVELRAVMLEPNSVLGDERRVQVELRTETTGFAQPYFVGIAVVGQPRSLGRQPETLPAPLPFAPERELYGRNFFVKGRFQRIQKVLQMEAARASCEAQAIELSQVDAFGGRMAGTRLLLGDPFLRDTFLHSAILSETQVVALPTGFDRVELGEEATRLRPGVRWALSRLVPVVAGKDYVAELTLLDAEQNVLERISGFRIRVMERHPEWPSAAALSGAVVQTERDDEETLRETVRRAASVVPHLLAKGK